MRPCERRDFCGSGDGLSGLLSRTLPRLELRVSLQCLAPSSIPEEPCETPVDFQQGLTGETLTATWAGTAIRLQPVTVESRTLSLDFSLVTCPGFLGVCTPQLPSGHGGRREFEVMLCCLLWRSFLLWPARQRMPERLWMQPRAGDARCIRDRPDGVKKGHRSETSSHCSAGVQPGDGLPEQLRTPLHDELRGPAQTGDAALLEHSRRVLSWGVQECAELPEIELEDGNLA